MVWSNEKHLKRIIQEKKPKIVVELGSWLGKSTRFIAKNLLDSKINGKVYAVDTWRGSAEHTSDRLDVKNKLPTLYQQFLSNCIHHKMTSIIIPIRMTTLEAAKALNVKPDLIYVDASHHEEDVYNDIMVWYKKLARGGIMCGDDWTWQSVVNAVKRAAHELGQEIQFEYNFWWFKAKK